MLLKTKIKHNSNRLCICSRSAILVLVSPYTCASFISGKQNVVFSLKTFDSMLTLTLPNEGNITPPWKPLYSPPNSIPRTVVLITVSAISVAVRKHYDQKQLGSNFSLQLHSTSPSLREVRTVKQTGQELKG